MWALNRVLFGDNLPVLRALESASVDLIYIDPPFNTGKRQARTTTRSVRDGAGAHLGFQGRRYTSVSLATRAFDDQFDDYLGFLEPRLIEARRLLKPSGTLYLHIDPREVHYVKVLLDRIFGRASFLNEIVWAYDYGARTKKRWAPKHDNILVYVVDPKRYYFSQAEIDRIPYMAPLLVSEAKRVRGKLPTDTWWHTIVSPTGREKLGYPTQKPLGILRRIVRASCPPGGLLLDFFAGSGTSGAAALECGRKFLMVDSNRAAIAVMKRRFAGRADVEFVGAARIKPVRAVKSPRAATRH